MGIDKERLGETRGAFVVSYVLIKGKASELEVEDSYGVFADYLSVIFLAYLARLAH